MNPWLRKLASRARRVNHPKDRVDKYAVVDVSPLGPAVQPGMAQSWITTLCTAESAVNGEADIADEIHRTGEVRINPSAVVKVDVARFGRP